MNTLRNESTPEAREIWRKVDAAAARCPEWIKERIRIMTTDETYNGYANRETWLVALWIDNEPGSYERSREMARIALDNAELHNRTPVGYLADNLLEWITDLSYDTAGTSGMFADLLGTALGRVDWYEIAENYIEEVSEEVRANEQTERGSDAGGGSAARQRLS